MATNSEGGKPRQKRGRAPEAEPLGVAGIGVAATAVASLQQLFGALSADLGAAYVVALESGEGLDAERIAASLNDVAGMPVLVAEDGQKLVPNTIYVGRQGQLLTINLGQIQVAPENGGHGAAGIDSVLTSIAETSGDHAVVIVLDGLGSEGTAAVAATKRCGGLSLAEAPRDPEPPNRAITATGIADLVLPVEEIPAQIAAYLRNLARTANEAAEAAADEVAAAISRIAAILRNATGNDFHGYKHATFLRRIHRRMQVVQVDQIDRYIERLRADPAEVQHLFQDLLIGVTQFFRDPAEFELVEREVIPKLFEGRGADERVRIWVLGCATGEEAYSIAILLREFMATLDVSPHVQIFATDIDARALAIARAGRYPESIAKHIAPERLARWFVKEGATYSVVKELREMCIFSPHNLIKDAPFSRIDLVSCRNLLIYLNSELQSRVIPIFHFSLRPGGFLFLGPSENVTRHAALFAPIDRRNRIFRRLDTPSRVLPDFPLSPRSATADAQGEATPLANSQRRALSSSIGRRVEQIAERYAPAFVVVDSQYDVLHFSGRTGRYLEPAAGAASLNLLNLVHRDLRLDLRTALHKVETQRRRIEVHNIPMGRDPEQSAVNLAIEPVPGGDEPRTMMVVFQDAVLPPEATGEAVVSAASDEHIQRLEAELKTARERLQTTVEELESTNEELKSSNEEYQSINEELQSANEELETSKEELQAVNEELQTVNGELAHRVGDLGRANSDLKNLLESTQIATIFLDNELRLRSFTPASTDVFHIVETDVGRSIAHIVSRLRYPELQDDARKVLKSLGQVEREVPGAEDDRRYLVRILPYRSIDNFIAGVVATFLDVSGAARAEAALRVSEGRFAEAQSLAGVGVWEWNIDSDETWWSPTVYAQWGLPPAEAPGDFLRMIHPQDRESYLAAMAQAPVSGQLDAEWRIIRPDGAERWLSATGRRDTSTGRARILGVTQDITERKLSETRLKLLLSELQHRVRNILAVVRSLVTQTLRSSTDLEDFASHLDGRLETLARTQGVVTRSAEGVVDLEELVREEMLAIAAGEEQVEIAGPEVELRPEAAETFALALHELATNAVKYGALSAQSGKVSVTWRIFNTSGGARLSLEWRETGVRALDISPKRSGFGRDLIERGLPFELGAATSLEFARGGVRALIELPLDGNASTPDLANARDGTDQ